MRAHLPILAHRDGVAPSRWNQPTGRASAADERSPRDRSSEGLHAEGFHAIRTVRSVLVAQIAIFLVLASIHFGLLIDSYQHRNAGTTELLIAGVMVAGLLLTWKPSWSRRAATWAQSFGAVAVLVGLFTLALGIRPLTILDLTLNGALFLILAAGLAMALRKP